MDAGPHSEQATAKIKLGHRGLKQAITSQRVLTLLPGERGRQLRRPLIVPNAFAALTLEKTNQLAFAAIEQGLSDTRKGTADGTAALRILRPLGR
jgi:hypothetical protein